MERGNYSLALLGVPQWTRTLSRGQGYNTMSHHSFFFHAMPKETSFWNSDQLPNKDPAQIYMQCAMTGCPFPSPATNLSRSYTLQRSAIPSPHHLKLSSHWKRKMVGNILGFNSVGPDFSLALPACPYKAVCASVYSILQTEIWALNCNKKLLSGYRPSWAQATSKRTNAYLTMCLLSQYTHILSPGFTQRAQAS